MTLFVCWVVFPGLLALLSIGCGLLLERLAGVRFPRALVPPAGFAALVVAAQFAALTNAGAAPAVALVVALAALGFAAAFPWRPAQLDPWPAVVAIAVFAVFAAPVVLTGEATFAGYVKLDDTSTFLALVDRALEHGRNLDGLAPSSYEAAVALNLPFYPIGSLLPLGIGATLSGQDPAWVFQPYLAFLASMLGLALFGLATPLVASPRLRALAAFVAAQPALLYGYALWGGVKELAVAPLIALLAALTAPALRGSASSRELLPLAVAAAAVIGVLSVGGAVWVVPAAAVVAVVLLRARQFRRLAAAAALLGVLLVPSLTVARFFFSSATTGPLKSETELGNLVAPLSLLQVVGIWPTGDFRLEPSDMNLTYVMMVVAVLAAAGGIFFAARRRAWGVLLYATCAVGAALLFERLGSPWVAAKALAIGAPAVLLAAMIGCAAVFSRGRRVEGAVLGLAVAFGVVWSNLLAYRETTLAPRQQLVELEQIGKRFEHQGPALMTEYQPYGVRHFLRSMDPEGASELRRRLVPLRDGNLLGKGEFADLDAFSPDALLVYRTIVLRRSPLASRPPAPYRLVWRRRFYEVWERPEPLGDTIVEHLALGGAEPAARPSCRAVHRLAIAGGLVAAPPARAVIGADPALVYPAGGGAIDTEVYIRTPGRYEVWLGGSFRGSLEISIDEARVGAARRQLNYAGQFTSLGEAALTAGEHTVHIAAGGPDLHPGSGGPPWALGPLVLSRSTGAGGVSRVPLGATGRLCHRSLDWIEAVAS